MLHSRQKINIMINLTSSKSGGAISYIKNLLPLLIRQFNLNSEHKLFILVTEFQQKYINNKDNANIIKVKKNIDNGFKRYLWEIYNLKYLTFKYDIDVIFTPYQLTSIVKGIENIVMIRNMEPFKFNSNEYKYSKKAYIRNFLLKLLKILKFSFN